MTMGDRANIAIVQDHGPGRVYLYGHWSGYDMPNIVQKALAKHWRWEDDAYLARVVFDVLTEGSHGQETGFGISTSICDNEHPIIVLDPKTQTVWLEDRQGKSNGQSWSFEAVAQSDETFEKAYEGTDA